MDRFLLKIGASSLSELDSTGKKQFILLCIDGFLHEELCLDQLAMLANTIWEPELVSDTQEQRKVKIIIQTCTELSLYIRKMALKPELREIFGHMYGEIMEFYSDNMDELL